ncbi:putative transposase [Halohasta litchfieldiae]|uniref:Putative transposase n=1 Tax=Halohasta litchfieldiae TaxID=1073996 RepID=A0A1H6WYB1_9EURY|nr:putative transposase [Halohasta litchfieldiae]
MHGVPRFGHQRQPRLHGSQLLLNSRGLCDTTKKLHSWAFDRIYQYLEYKGEISGVEVLKENEWNTSKTCSQCGDDTKSNRKYRGLYVCSSCELVANADCNGAENMRQKITPSPHGEDRSNGCVAQPSTHLFDSESGAFAPREQVVS